MRGRAQTGARRGCSSMPPVPGSTHVLHGALGPQRRAQCPPGAGQPHRRAASSTTRARLFLPERRRPHHLRHSLRGRLHADRHHRPATMPATRARCESPRRRSTICAPRRASISRSRSRRADIVWTYSGVRPLYDDGASKAQEATRDYVLKAERRQAAPPASTSSAARSPPIAGCAESVLEKIASIAGARGTSWTAKAPLPGGDFPVEGFDVLLADAAQDLPFLDARACMPAGPAVRHQGSTSCSAARKFARCPRPQFRRRSLRGRGRLSDAQEWAQTAEDVLWRRTKRGLRLNKAQAVELDAWMAARRAEQPGVAAAQ